MISSAIRSYGRLLASLLAVIAMVACEDRSTGPADHLAARVIALGFSTEGMQDRGTYVVVEGDIRLDKASLFPTPVIPSSGTRSPRSPVFQYHTTTLVSDIYVRQITVDLTNINAISNWAAAARTAIAAYNASGSAVHMSEASPGDITFSSVQTLPFNAIAEADFPYQGTPSGKPGPTITVAQDYNGLALNQKELTVVHELGHTLGLRHDNAPYWEGDAGIGAHRVYGTPVTDPNSVMLRSLDGRTWIGFSQYDLIALKTLYDPITLTITGPMYVIRDRTCTWTGNASGGVPPYTYAWYVQQPATAYFSPYSGTQQSFASRGTNSFQMSFPITLTVTDATGWHTTRAAYVTSWGSASTYYDPTYCY